MLRVIGDAAVAPESPPSTTSVDKISADNVDNSSDILTAQQVHDKLRITPENHCKHVSRTTIEKLKDQHLDIEGGSVQSPRKRKRDGSSLEEKKQPARRPARRHGSKSVSSRSASDIGSVGSDAKFDHIGHHCGTPGLRIKDRYEIKQEIGMGTFGKVFSCFDHKHGDMVAVKVVRSIKRYVDSAKIEADILDHVYDCQAKQKTNYCLKLYSHFKFDDHYCLVTEKLGLSLYDILKLNKYRGFPMRTIRRVARQLLQAMKFLRSINLIHTDLKVENVLFVGDIASSLTESGSNGVSTGNEEGGGDSSRRRSSASVEQYPDSSLIKIIDFGGATYDNEKKSTIINTRQYRSPEVLLETSWSFPSDIWSVGCIIAEIYLGGLLFQTHGNLEHLALIERCCGLFPYRLLEQSPVSRQYFDSRGKTRLSELSSESQDHVRDIKRLRDVFALEDRRDRSGIADLMKALLEIDPGRRATASQALQMTFVR